MHTDIMKYSAVIFDVGDTLVRAWPSRREAMRMRFGAVGIELSENMADVMMRAVEAAELSQIRREQAGAPRMGNDDFLNMVDRAAAEAVGHGEIAEALNLIPLPKSELRLIDGVTGMLEGLKAAGLRLAIVSNHYRWLRDELERLGIAKYFEVIVISEEAGVEKPDPEIMNIALRRLGLQAGECVYVGDHPYDVLCAGRAGMDCIWAADADAELPGDVPYRETGRIASAADMKASV